MRVKLVVPALVLTLGASAFAFGPKQPDSLARLRQARVESSIDGPDMKPWHLTFTFELFDEKGAQLDSGTVDEWWAPAKRRIAVASKGYTAMLVHNESGYFRTPNAESVPESIDRMRIGIVHPLSPSLFSNDRDMAKARKETVGGTTLDCIAVWMDNGLNPTAPLVSYPTYCLGEGTSTLRLAKGLAESLTLGRLGRFAGHSTAVDLTLHSHGVLAGKAHITGLQAMPEADGDFENTTGLVALDVIPLDGDMKSPELTSRDNDGLSNGGMDHGAAELMLIVGKNGHVKSAKVLKTDNQAYAESLVRGAANWRYRPYLIDGVPASFETRLQLTFSTSTSVVGGQAH